MESASDVDYFWVLLLALYLALMAWLVFAWLRDDPVGGGSLGGAVDPSQSSPPLAPASNLRGWLDQKARILISRRPRHRHHRKPR